MNINRVVLTGNPTRDPELRTLPSGTAVCSLRIASNTRRKDDAGRWIEKPNYLDVVVWGSQGEACSRYLSKGRPVAIDGRLEWREFESRAGERRQTVEIVAENVQFLGGEHAEARPGQGDKAESPGAPGEHETGAVDRPEGAQPSDDEIPF